MLPQIGELDATVRSLRAAQWPWLAGALAASSRYRIRRILTRAVDQLGGVVRDPRRAAELWLGSLGITTLYIASFACSLAAFSAQVPLEHVAFVYVLRTAVSAAVPTPGFSVPSRPRSSPG